MSDVTPPPAPEPAPVPYAVPQAAPQPPSYGAPVALVPKELVVAYLLWFVLGIFGAHHFYLGKVGRGFLWLFTLGLLGVGLVIDLFTLPAQVRQVNAQRAVGIK